MPTCKKSLKKGRDEHMKSEELRKSFGLGLMVLRRQHGLTVVDVSRQTGLSRQHLSSYERGKSMPTIESLQKLSNALGVPIGNFYQAQLQIERIGNGTEGEQEESGDGTSPPHSREPVPAITHKAALKLAQEVGKAVAHV